MAAFTGSGSKDGTLTVTTGRSLRFAFLVLLALTAGGLSFLSARADAAPKLGYVKVAMAEQPTSLASPPGYPRLIFVTQREGKLRAIHRGRLLANPLLDLTRQIDSLRIERGLLGLAFAPDFASSGRFYLNHTDRAGDSVVVEYRSKVGKPLQVIPASRRLVIRIPRVNENGNHNGGHLAFFRNLLYISIGDGFDPGDLPDNAQNPESLRGKLLRIDPRPDPVSGSAYRVPPDNPFVGVPGRDEIFAIGFRNPYSFSFFRDVSGREMITISDVGQSRFEELNVLPLEEARGANFGWNDYEGYEPYNCGELYCPNGLNPTTSSGLTWPQLVYTHDDGCAIIGGPMIADPSLTSASGRIIYGDFCGNRIRTAAPHSPTILDDRPAGFYLPPGEGRHSALNGFGTDGFKRVYAFSHFGGIYRIVQR